MVTLDHLDLDPGMNLANSLLESEDIPETLRLFAVALLKRRLDRNKRTMAYGLCHEGFASTVEYYRQENERLTEALQLLEEQPG